MFKYLGQTITPDGKNEQEINIKIATAKNRFQQLYKVLTSKKISIKLRHRILVCYIFSVILYGCETWTLTKNPYREIGSMRNVVLQAHGQN